MHHKYPRSPNGILLAISEASILARIDHPGPDSPKPCFAENTGGQSLDTSISKPSNREAPKPPEPN